MPTLLISLTTEEILNNFVQTIAIPNLQGEFTVTLTSKKGDVREIRAHAYQKQISRTQDNKLFLFDFPPAVRGTGLLLHSYYDDRPNNMWIYLPAVRRIKRIALESSGGGYFMGSDFTYRDLIFINNNQLDFEQLPETTIDGHDCYVLKTQGKTQEIKQEYGYDWFVSYYRKDTYLVQRREYFDFNGELLKVYNLEESIKLQDYNYPSKISMTNVQTGHKSVIEVTSISVDEIPEKQFTTRALAQ